ncbi:MAG: hypothetical protein RLP02_06035 [Coleofasciculus sp. C2-GNP5-27]
MSFKREYTAECDSIGVICVITKNLDQHLAIASNNYEGIAVSDTIYQQERTSVRHTSRWVFQVAQRKTLISRIYAREKSIARTKTLSHSRR